VVDRRSKDRGQSVPVIYSTCLRPALSTTFTQVTLPGNSNNISTCTIASSSSSSSSRPCSSPTETTPRRSRCAGPPLSRRYCVNRRRPTPSTPSSPPAPVRSTATSPRRCRPSTTTCRLHRRHRQNRRRRDSARSDRVSNTSTRCPSSRTAAAAAAAALWRTKTSPQRTAHHHCTAS